MNDNFEPQDLSNVENNSLYIETEGSHTVVIEKATNTTSNKGTPGWTFTLRDAEGKSINHTLWLTEPAKPILKDFCLTAGLSEEQLAGFIPPMIYGRTVVITTKNNPDNPKYQAVTGVFPSTTKIDPKTIPPMPAKPATSDDVPF